MDLTPFFLEFRHRKKMQSVEVRPCCREEDVIYYDIWIDDQYQFTITPALLNGDKPGWRIALKNADKVVDQDLVQEIGVEIESYYL